MLLKLHWFPWLLAILLSPAPSWAGDQVPYKDYVEAEVVGAAPVAPNLIQLSFEVLRGQGTHVGRFTTQGVLFVNTSTFDFIGENTLTAANGDQIFIDIVGELTPTSDPDVLSFRSRPSLSVEPVDSRARREDSTEQLSSNSRKGVDLSGPPSPVAGRARSLLWERTRNSRRRPRSKAASNNCSTGMVKSIPT